MLFADLGLVCLCVRLFVAIKPEKLHSLYNRGVQWNFIVYLIHFVYDNFIYLCVFLRCVIFTCN